VGYWWILAVALFWRMAMSNFGQSHCSIMALTNRALTKCFKWPILNHTYCKSNNVQSEFKKKRFFILPLNIEYEFYLDANENSHHNIVKFLPM
jgi:hypothetical protein